VVEWVAEVGIKDESVDLKGHGCEKLESTWPCWSPLNVESGNEKVRTMILIPAFVAGCGWIFIHDTGAPRQGYIACRWE